MVTAPTLSQNLEEDFVDAQLRVALRLLEECTEELAATSARLNKTTAVYPSVIRTTASRLQRHRVQQFRAALEGFVGRLAAVEQASAPVPPPLPATPAPRRPAGRASRPRIEIEIVAAGEDDADEITAPWRFRRKVLGKLPQRDGAEGALRGSEAT